LDLCLLCYRALPCRPSPKLFGEGLVLAGFDYGNPVDGLIRHFKFQAQLGAGRLLARLCEPAFEDSRPMALVPVPMHIRRLRQRGFNQSLELASYWGRRRGLPVLPSGLIRHRDTAMQSTLTSSEREPNVRGAFRAVMPLPRHVALIDDVFTTGATCRAAREALFAAGVQQVDVWCLARVP
jgi:ComF family protein